MHNKARLASCVVGAITASSPLAAQTSGGFIARLGVDTVHIERFVRAGNRASGTVVMHAPAMRVIRWSMTYDDRGAPARYQVDAVDANGSPVLNGASGTMTFRADTIIREAYSKGERQTVVMAAPNGANPSPGLPYFGVSYLMYEDAFIGARRRAAAAVDSVPYLYQLSMTAGQRTPARSRAWFVSADSAELDYFGVARSGYKFDAGGALVRADWTGTTYHYRIERVPATALDVDAIAAAWSAAERAGKGPGSISPRDSVTAVVDSSQVTFDYSRPAKRGRDIWGGIVPWDKVWRLGADMATHFTTSENLTIGATPVSAGRYTLWMIPSETAPMLVVSSAVNVFGTNYNPAKDVARIPLRRSAASAPAERLTMAVRDGAMWIVWDDVAWSVPVRQRK